MATKRDRNFLSIIVLLTVLLLAALGGWGYHYSKIAGFENDKNEALESLAKEHKLELAVAEGNLKIAKADLKTAEKKIEKFDEKEAILLKRIKEIEEKYKNKNQAQASAPVKTIKTAHKAKPPKKMKPCQFKKAGKHKKVGQVSKKANHDKKQANVSKKTGNANKYYKRIAKHHDKKPGKVHATTNTISLATLCEGNGPDVPFFQQLLKDTTTYGYTVKVWEKKHGSVKRLQILLTGPEVPNVQ